MKNMRTLILAILSVLACHMQAQTYLLPVSGTTLLAGTNFTLKDAGGDNNIPAGCSGSITISPTVPGQKVRITFSSLNLGGSSMYIYNGTSVGYSQAAQINSVNQASYSSVTSTDIMGSLTISLNGAYSNLTSGFVALIDEVAPYPAPGLTTALTITSLAPYYTGITTGFSLKLTNSNGVGPLFNTFVEMVLSTDTIFDYQDSILLAQTFGNNGNVVQPGQSSTLSGTVQLPGHIPAGNYYLLSVTDYYVSPGHLSGHLAISHVPITLAQGFKDLVLSNPVLYQDTVAIGYAFGGSVSIADSGTLGTPTNEAGVYLSTDSVLDASDILVDTFAVYNLNALQSSGGYYTTWPIPANVTPGIYYVIVKGDIDNTISESNKQNNVVVKKAWVINPYYDLAISLTNILPDTIYAGSPNNLNYALHDYSKGPTGSRTAADFYISLNNVLDTSDILIGSSTIQTSPFGYPSPLYCVVPEYMSGGNYFLIGKIDAQYNYDDINTGNNVSVQPVFVVPMSYDLQFTQGSTPDSIITNPGTYTTINTHGVVTNNGASNVYNATASVYFSTDTVFSMDDLLLGSTTITVLHNSATQANFNYLSVPADTTRHYLLYVADPASTVPEYNERNNTLAVPLNIRFPHADLALTGSKPDTVRAAVLQANTTVKVYYNNYSANTVSSNLGIYISTDTTLGGIITRNLYYIQTQFPAHIRDSATFYFSMPNIAPGNYYLIVIADSGNHLFEPNMANNILAIPLIVDSFKVDLSFQHNSVNCAANLAAGYPAAFNGYVLNNSVEGSLSGGPCIVSVFAASDTLLQGPKVFIGSTSLYSFAGGAYFNFTDTVPLSALGYPYIVFMCDSGNTIIETNYNNNLAWEAVTIGPPLYNLYPTNPSVSTTSLYPNTPFTVSCRINNAGNAPVPLSYARVYLSADTIYQVTDLQLTSAYVTGIGATGYQLMSANVYGGIPAPGNYYLLFYADATNLISETNESDNIIYLPITITPFSYDIQMAQFTAGATQLPISTTISSLTKIYNNSNSSVDSFDVSLYLSQDTVYHPGDILVGNTRVLQNIYAGGSSYVNVSTTVPYGTLTGNYNLVAFADAGNIYAETNELNNFKYAPVQVINSAFDIYPLSNDSLFTLYIGNNVSIPSFNICNFGVTPSPASVLSLYLSADSLVDASDIKLQSNNLYSLAPMTSTTGSFYFRVPNVASGNYYLIAYADSTYRGSESNGNNNFFVWHAYIPPPVVDIAICNMTLADTIYAGTYAQPQGNYTVCNIGTEASPPFNCELLLSTIPVPDSSARVLNYSTGYYIPAQGTYPFLLNGQIPANTPPGVYYIIAFANYGYLGPDTNRLNNYESFRVTILAGKPDLLIDSAYVQDTIYKNESNVNTSFRLRNAGPIAVIYNYYQVQIFLSTDSFYSLNDILLNSYGSNNLNGFSSAMVNTSLSGYSNGSVPPGWYYLIYKVDTSQYFVESNYDNNTFVKRVYVAPPFADLGISSFTINNQIIVSGVTETLNVSISNYSQNLYSTGCYGKFYWSRDSVVNSNAVFLDSFSVQGITGAYYNATQGYFSYAVPNMTPGRYYYICEVDKHNINNDPYRPNNHWAIPFEVQPANIDLVPVSISVPGGYINQGNNYTFSVKNIGNTITPPFLCSAYLSTDSILSGNDYLAMTYNYANSLNSNTTSNFYASITNGDVPAGVYYLIFKVNSNDSVNETNYNNNQMFIKVSYRANHQTYLLPDSAYGAYVYCGDTLIFNGDASYNPASQVTQYTLQGINNSYPVVFKSFSLDSSASLNIYNGYNTSGPLLGTFTGNTNPGNVYSSNGALTLKVNAANHGGNFSAYYSCSIPANVDLYFDSATISADTLIASNTFVVNSYIHEVGNTSYFSRLDYELSASSFYVPGDYDMLTIQVPTIANTSVQQMDVVTVPTGQPDGPCYLLLMLDRDNYISETNENNNTLAFPVIYKQSTGIQLIVPQNPFYYWQNQSAKMIHVLCNNSLVYDSRLYDDLGRLIIRKNGVTGTTDYPVVSDGVYILELAQNGQSYRYKVAVY